MRGSVAPSRTAAIGGTRVARRAGMMLAISVTSVPTQQRHDDRARRETVPASGRSAPSATNSALRPLAIPSPATRPTTEASEADHEALEQTERMTCLRDAPSVRRVANSRVRWATVIDRVLKITNAPTNSAMPPKPRKK